MQKRICTPEEITRAVEALVFDGHLASESFERTLDDHLRHYGYTYGWPCDCPDGGVEGHTPHCGWGSTQPVEIVGAS